MSQFDVFENIVKASRAIFPLVVELQSEVSASGPNRLIAYLTPAAMHPPAASFVVPSVEIGGTTYLLVLPTLTNLPVSSLVIARGNISEYRDAIVRGIDWLFCGI